MLSLRDLTDTWASIYAGSAGLRSAVSFAHVGGLVAGGGCAIAADRATLRAFRRSPDMPGREIEHLHGVHRVVLAGLGAVMMSGVLLMLADLDAYLESTVFWIKMALVAALIANGAILVRFSGRAHEAEPSAPAALRRASLVSLVLWFATTLAGTVLPNVL